MDQNHGNTRTKRTRPHTHTQRDTVREAGGGGKAARLLLDLHAKLPRGAEEDGPWTLELGLGILHKVGRSWK